MKTTSAKRKGKSEGDKVKLTLSKQFKELLTATIKALSEVEIITDGEPMKLSEKMITLGQALTTVGHYGKDDFDSIDKEE